MQRMECHLYDLYTYIPGLREVSEMLLGITDYDPSMLPTELRPSLPLQYEEVQTSLTPEEKLEAFRSQPTGRLFIEEAEEVDAIAKQEEPPPSASSSTRKRPRQGSSEPSASNVRPLSPAPAVQDSSNIFSMSPALTGLTPTNASTSQSAPSHALQPFSYHSMTMPNNGNEDYSPKSVITSQQQIQAPLPIAKSFYWHRGNSNVAKSYGPTSGFSNIDVSVPSPAWRSAPLDIANLPPIAYRARLLDVYVNVIHPLVPMCSRQMLMQWAYEQKPVFDEQGGPELLFAVLACASPYMLPGAEGEARFNGENMAHQARNALQQALAEPSISCVQAQILLAMYEWGIGNFTMAWLYLGEVILLVHSTMADAWLSSFCCGPCGRPGFAYR